MPSDINNITQDQWGSKYSVNITLLTQALNEAKRTADEWYKFTYGKTSAEVAALPNMSPWTETDVDQVTAVSSAIRTLYDIMAGNATLANAYNFLDAFNFFV